MRRTFGIKHAGIYFRPIIVVDDDCFYYKKRRYSWDEVAAIKI